MFSEENDDDIGSPVYFVTDKEGRHWFYPSQYETIRDFLESIKEVEKPKRVRCGAV